MLPGDLQAEAAAWEELEFLRGWWDQTDEGRVCPHCGVVGRFIFLNPREGSPRRTRTGRPTVRRVWKCGACRRQFTALTGPRLAGTRLPIRVWSALLFRWIEIVEEEGRRPTVKDVAAVHPSLRGNEAWRAYYRIQDAPDGDFLTTYRDW